MDYARWSRRQYQREALQHTFERVLVSKVPPRSEPKLEFIVRDAHPWQVEYAPVDVERIS